MNRHKGYKNFEAELSKRYVLTDKEENHELGQVRMIHAGYKGIQDAQDLFRNMAGLDMPFLTQKALEFALFRTYGIPTISKILLRTGQFVAQDKSSRRYVDTSILISSFFTYPLPIYDLEDNVEKKDNPSRFGGAFGDPNREDPRSAIAIARINWLHARADSIHRPHGAGISNDDLLYTLSVFVTVPLTWYNLYGWRNATPLEAEALFTVFYHVGRCMGIQDIPSTREGLSEWADEYEKRKMVFAEQNKTVAIETVNLLLHHVPLRLRPALSKPVSALMDERLRLSMGFQAAPKWVEYLTKGALKLSAILVRFTFLPRKKFLSIVPVGDEAFSNTIAEGHRSPEELFSVCPATGIKAGEENGKMCPVGDAKKWERVTDEMSMEKSKPRLTLNWWENDYHYSRAAPKYSSVWFYEQLFVPLERRRGAKVWRPANMPRGLPEGPVEGLDCGYRLEECGPKGLEDLGREKVYDEAKKLHGGKELQGVWSFDRNEK